MKKSQPEKQPKAKNPSDLVKKGGKKADIELSETELDKASGGAIDSYIKIDPKA